MQSEYAWPTLAFACITAVAIAADWRGHRRRDADRVAARVPIIPWALVSIFALIATAYCVARWIKGD